ncbi:MAG: peptidyl-prolyl cis-trans isomerase D [Gammaproteobacteria bacterium]|jgi:peptidyl-prolyl cis-trans isomerase D
MLQLIRDRATGWIAWVIIVLICIPFALFGINQYFDVDQGLVVATVDESEISYYQYRNAVQQQRAQLQQMLGGNVGQELLDSPQMREQVLQSLIDDEAMLQGAVKTGLRVGDVQVARAIQLMPVFQDAGQFSLERYNAMLRAQGLNSEGFELNLRRSLLSEQVRAAVRRTEIVTSTEVDRALTLRNERRVLKLLDIDPSALQLAAIDEASIKSWYEAHLDQYVQPEQVSIRYIELSRDDIAKAITTTDEELRTIYEQRVQQGSFGLPEQREARHILIEVDSAATSEDVAAARAVIDAARKRIVDDAEAFADVAKEVSQDAGSAPLGGQLGQFGRDVMDPAFEKTAFSLALSEVSEPVRSRFGWHVIEVTKIEAAQVRSFEESRADLLGEYQLRRADEKFAEQAAEIADLGFVNPESLEVAAEAADLPILSSGFFTLRGERAEGVTANPRLRAAAFSDDVLEAGNNSELIEIAGERRVLFRLAERKPQRQNTLEEVRDQVVSALKFGQGSKQAIAVGERVLADLRKGLTLAEIAEETATDFVESGAQKISLQWSADKTISRDESAGVPSTIAKLAFGLRQPSADNITYAGEALPTGGFTIVALVDVSQMAATHETKAKEQRERAVRELQAGRAEQTYTAVQKSVRSRANVTIKQQNLRPDDG